MNRPPCQQLLPAETQFCRHSRDTSSAEKPQNRWQQRKPSGSRAHWDIPVALGAPTQKVIELGLVSLGSGVVEIGKESAQHQDRAREFNEIRCGDCELRVTLAQHPAFPHLTEAEARILGLSVPVIAATSSINHSSFSEVDVSARDDVAYFKDTSHRYPLPVRPANGTFSAIFKRSKPRTASFVKSTRPQLALPPKSPSLLSGKVDKFANPNEVVDVELRSSISTRVRAAQAVFHAKLARGDFDQRTEKAYFCRPSALCDPERIGSEKIFTDIDLYEGRRLSPLDYARAAYIEAAQARREGRQSQLTRPIVNFWHTKNHREFLVTPEVPKSLSPGIRIPCLPAVRLSGGLEATGEAAAIDAGFEDTRPVQPQEISAVEEHDSICRTPDSTAIMLRFMKRGQRSRQGSDSNGADNDKNQSSNVESPFVKTQAHPPVLPDFDFSSSSEQQDNAFGLARMHSIARRYNGDEWQTMSKLRVPSDKPVDRVIKTSEEGMPRNVNTVATSSMDSRPSGNPTRTEKSLATAIAEAFEPESGSMDADLAIDETRDIPSSTYGTSGSQRDALIISPAQRDSIAARRRSARLVASNELITATPLPAKLKLPTKERLVDANHMPGLQTSTTRNTEADSSSKTTVNQDRSQDPVISNDTDLFLAQANFDVPPLNTSQASANHLSPVPERSCDEESPYAKAKVTITQPIERLASHEVVLTRANKDSQCGEHDFCTDGLTSHRNDGPISRLVGHDNANAVRDREQSPRSLETRANGSQPAFRSPARVSVGAIPPEDKGIPIDPVPRRRPITYAELGAVQRKSACVSPLFSTRQSSAPISARANPITTARVGDNVPEQYSVKPLALKERKRLPAPSQVSSEPEPAGLRDGEKISSLTTRTPLGSTEQTNQLVDEIIHNTMSDKENAIEQGNLDITKQAGSDRGSTSAQPFRKHRRTENLSTDIHPFESADERTASLTVVRQIGQRPDAMAGLAGPGGGMLATGTLRRPRRSATYRLTPIKSVKTAKSEELIPRPKTSSSSLEAQGGVTSDLSDVVHTANDRAMVASVSGHQATKPPSLHHDRSSSSLASPQRQAHIEDRSCLTATTTTSSQPSLGSTSSGESVTNRYYPGSPTHSMSNENYPYHPGARPRLWKEIPMFDKYHGTLVEQDAREKAAKEETARIYRERREKKLAAKAEIKELKRLRKLEDEEAKRQQRQWGKQYGNDPAGSLPTRYPAAATLPVLMTRNSESAAREEVSDHVRDLSRDLRSTPRKRESLPTLRYKPSTRVLAGIFGSTS